jgi:hypothetical protein
VVAGDRDDRDAGLAQPPDLADVEQRGVEVAPRAVEDVAGDQDECDPLLERQVDEVRQRPPRCSPELLDGRAVVGGEPEHRAVEVDVGGVEELHAWPGSGGGTST